MAAIVTLAIVVNVGSAIRVYHPYEPIYYNSLVGGLSGARYKYGFPEATDYWASSYRQGVAWLNANAPPDSALHVPIAEWVVQLPARLWLRQDIDIVSEEAVNELLAVGRPVYVMFITRTGWYNEIATYCDQQLHPIHEIVVDGFPILEIYRLSGDLKRAGIRA